MNVTPVFFYRHLSSSTLFSCTFLSFLALLRLSGIFSHSLLAPDHRSPIVCLLHHSRACPLFCHHPCPCQSVHLLPSPPSFFSFTFSYLSAYPSLCHFFFCFSGGKADEWLDRAIPLLRGSRFNLRGHRHQQLGVPSKRPWSLGVHRINDLSVSSGQRSLIRSTSWERCQ